MGKPYGNVLRLAASSSKHLAMASLKSAWVIAEIVGAAGTVGATGTVGADMTHFPRSGGAR